MTRETIQAKASRYLISARLTVLAVRGDHVHAQCRGDGEVYDLGHHPARGWWCDCAARRDCAHLVALRSVVVRRAGE